MKTFVKVAGTLFFTVLTLVVIGFVMIFSLLGSGCHNEIFSEVISPNGKYKAVVFERNCGATTGYSTQVSILPASRELQNKKGNVFIQDGHPDWTEVRVIWIDDKNLNIDFQSDYQVYTQRSFYRRYLNFVSVNFS